MLANVGLLDRALRIVSGVVLIALAQLGSDMEWAWIGVLPLMSGLVRHCPLYAKLGLSTCGGN